MKGLAVVMGHSACHSAFFVGSQPPLIYFYLQAASPFSGYCRTVCCQIWVSLLPYAGLTGLGPAASSVTGKRSSRLSYNPPDVNYNIEKVYYVEK